MPVVRAARAPGAAGARGAGGGVAGGGGGTPIGRARRRARPARPRPAPRRAAAGRALSASRSVVSVACVVCLTRAFRCRCDPVVVEVMPAEEDPAAMECREPVDSPQQFCLRWNNYQSNLTSSFDQLLQTQSFVDVTLSCDGQSLKAHKVVLSACSPYFQSLFMDNPCQHPIIIMRDTKYCDLKAAVDFMYRGEINVSQEQIPALLKVAESLKIRGLTDVSGEHAVVAGARAAKREGARDASPPKARRRVSEEPAPARSPSPAPQEPPPEPAPPLHPDDVDIRPGIAEMIREEERVSPLPLPSHTAAAPARRRTNFSRRPTRARPARRFSNFPTVAHYVINLPILFKLTTL
ncbi:hypothetical protein PYW07_000570 [Mythimna separata]|uniref:BTB domain-containing protein n=1 Tax=Mythimna separata TaxID=271217 RepID=A0AAD7Z3D5_MYTSE|nr:hypothetical protein PYW07_000570 [Mythimna separata]